MANLLSIRSGAMTLSEVIARQGRNPDAVLAEIAATNAKLDALGLVLDSDPRPSPNPSGGRGGGDL